MLKNPDYWVTTKIGDVDKHIAIFENIWLE
jgi:hypothetical protein